MEELKKYIREVPDYPVKGVSFKDISPLLAETYAINKLSRNISWQTFQGLGYKGLGHNHKPINSVIAIDSRGFIVGSALACYDLFNCGFIMARKIGKLPEPTVKSYYNSEYSKDGLCISSLLDLKGKKVHIHDDVLATGGTINCAIDLLNQLGAEIHSISFIIELTYLNGREKINFDKDKIFSVIKY